MTMIKRWWLPPEQRQDEIKKKRQPYKWGLKAFLSSFEIGETRVIKDGFTWDGIRTTASRLKREYGCQFLCSEKRQTITRTA